MKVYTGIGSRETPEDVCKTMTGFARFASDLGWTLRSGAAWGADTAFEAGADKKEIYLPWWGFANRRNPEPDLIYPPTDEAFRIASEFHPLWDRLTGSCRKLHARNAHQVLGYDCRTPTRFVICWTKDGRASGGTGQALRIAKDYGIPIFNLRSPNGLFGAMRMIHKFK